MPDFVKRGTNAIIEIPLSVRISDVDEAHFIFKQKRDSNAPVLKCSAWKSDGTGDAEYADGKFRVTFTAAEVYRFRPNQMMYFDSFVIMEDEFENPQTEIGKVYVSDTLFRVREPGGEIEPGCDIILSGIMDYSLAINKPSINGHEIDGDMSSEDLGLAKGGVHLERLSTYLCKASYDTVPPIVYDDPVAGSCSSYVSNGKMYRNFDWNYDESVSFIVSCPGFTGMAFGDGISDSLLESLPYRIVDGVNDYGIMVSEHVLYNDWEWDGDGDVPLYMVPYLIMTQVEDIEDVFSLPLGSFYATPSLKEQGYLLQFIVSDGETTYVIAPSETDASGYCVIDATSNPKLTNFRWVPDVSVSRADLQLRPTGVERWNMMPCPLEDLRFTKAYEQPDRLSEFIGYRHTTKDSTDDELFEIYEFASELYSERERDGSTWQTVHSVVYSASGMEGLYVQEDYGRNYIAGKISHETWIFTLDDDSIVAKDVCLWS